MFQTIILQLSAYFTHCFKFSPLIELCRLIWHQARKQTNKNLLHRS